MVAAIFESLHEPKAARNCSTDHREIDVDFEGKELQEKTRSHIIQTNLPQKLQITLSISGEGCIRSDKGNIIQGTPYFHGNEDTQSIKAPAIVVVVTATTATPSLEQ